MGHLPFYTSARHVQFYAQVEETTDDKTLHPMLRHHRFRANQGG